MELSTPCNINADGRHLHVLMFPWLAHGHISPYVQLSERLAQHGIDISFVSTPLNIPKIKSLFAKQRWEGEVKFVELSLPYVDGLPAGIESTTDLPSHLMPLLIQSVDGFQTPFQTLLQQLSPDCVMYDLLYYWAPGVSAKLGIPSIFFITSGAAYFSYHFCPVRGEDENVRTAEDLTRQPPDFPPSAISLHLFEARSKFTGFYENKIAGMTGIHRVLRCYDACSAIAIKSCHEIEGKFIEYFQKVTGKPVLPLGPLLPDLHKRSLVFDESSSRCLTWLDKQPASSVVYASFGSEYFLSEEQIRELVLGLEASGVPFICVLRFPACSDQQRRASASLPDGFERRIVNRGLVVGGWAPQREILSHPSTGGFLSHCGWSSLMEGMSSGLPIIALPMQIDQDLNARLVVEELKVGIEVARDPCDGSFGREAICRGVRWAMIEEGGREMRSEAERMGHMFTSQILNGSQNMYIRDLIQHLHGLKEVGFEPRGF